MGFFSRLEIRAKEIDSLLCVGLDPHVDQLSSEGPKAALEFCKRIVDATADLVLAYKPNCAFFEVFGSEGLVVLETLVAFIPDDIPIILDGKRGDIASSAQAYAAAIFETLRADAATVNPYLGFDAIAPFLQHENKGVFLLCKTSNPGSRDFQDLEVRNSIEDLDFPKYKSMYQLIAVKAVEWNVNDNLGLVVGATQNEPLRIIRDITPDQWILAPGVGAQGGDLDLALEAGLRNDGLGMVIPVSRGISKSADPRQAAINLNQRINHHRLSVYRDKTQSESIQVKNLRDKRLAMDILKFGCVKFGKFTLKSGLNSPIYIDLRKLTGDPNLLSRVAIEFTRILNQLAFDLLAGLPYAGLPIATAVSLTGNWPLVYPRKESKKYGTQVEIEGVFTAGQKVVLIDDLATTGDSKFEAIKKLEAAGLSIKDVVVLIDRESGAAGDLSKSGYKMHAVFTLSELLQTWFSEGLISGAERDEVQNFISETR